MFFLRKLFISSLRTFSTARLVKEVCNHHSCTCRTNLVIILLLQPDFYLAVSYFDFTEEKTYNQGFLMNMDISDCFVSKTYFEMFLMSTPLSCFLKWKQAVICFWEKITSNHLAWNIYFSCSIMLFCFLLLFRVVKGNKLNDASADPSQLDTTASMVAVVTLLWT